MNTDIQPKITQPVMRYHGGKFRLADFIIDHFPEHRCYVEPFGGAGSVLMKKHRAYAEVYNDMDGEIVNVFRVLRDPDMCEALVRACVNTPYSRSEFELAFEESEDLDPVERARRTLFRAQSGFGSAGATKGSTGFRIDSERAYGLSSHLWANYPAALSQFTTRLSGVIVENRPALSVMLQHDAPDTLHYLDPPYVWDTRYGGSDGIDKGRCYRHELTNEDHRAFLAAALELEGMVIISGYMSDLYHKTLTNSGWVLRTKKAQISGYRGTASRTECIWMNPKCVEAQTQQSLF